MNKETKILLLLMPFWDPQIPPSGIGCLKSSLVKHGYRVNAVDANVDEKLKENYHRYFDCLKAHIPVEKRGNFYKIGHDVLRNHMTAHLNYTDEAEYTALIKDVIYQIFFIDVADDAVSELKALLDEFYVRLEAYILDLLDRERPDVLGISTYSDTLAASLTAFRLAKEKYPAIHTVMGGGIFASDLAPGTPNLDYLLEKAPYIDALLAGEGELLFLRYLEGLLPQSQRVFTLEDIDREILDVSQADLPDFSDFHLEYYPYITAYTSRSCPFQCKFCAETMYWGGYRKKSTDQAVEELKTLYHRYGSQLFLMSDSLLNPVVTDLARRMTEEDISIYWDGFLRADAAAGDKEKTLLWRRGGFYRARMGMESGSQRLLDLMNKKTTLEQMKAAVTGLASAGIKTTTYWVVGFPGETEADFQQTLDFLEEMADDIFEADCSPFWYFWEAQEGDSLWKDKRKLLFPESAREMLLIQTWIVDCEPHREEIYRRMQRFTDHCKKLGIPNPYSMLEFHEADKRWKKLHDNAPPPLVAFDRGGPYIDENRHINILQQAAAPQDNGDFAF